MAEAQNVDQLEGLDIAGLNDLISRAKARVVSLRESGAQQRVKDFLASDFYKDIMAKAKAIQAKIKELPKSGEFKFTVTVRATGKKGDVTVIDAVMGNCGHANNSLSAKAIRIEAEASRARLWSLSEQVNSYVEDMCEDGWEMMFPELADAHNDIDTEISDLRNEYYGELTRCGIKDFEILQELNDED